MEWKAGTNPAQFRRLESKKNPVAGEMFFLTSPFIELGEVGEKSPVTKVASLVFPSAPEFSAGTENGKVN
jgi:hypothetical protein